MQHGFKMGDKVRRSAALQRSLQAMKLFRAGDDKAGDIVEFVKGMRGTTWARVVFVDGCSTWLSTENLEAA